ncbi:uncharacterized protein MEPE_02963 [Melanopsichium pennsylvanicum]|uniref:Uncharacterized protein n=1 Tax=Melanopsichium pennsylvanicum TaxID=63383 RepID=A0AAJ5C516_9BASI|nr:uncharacterized protein MEPE_02963 [Melanopsichium pennsylvanicum]
MQRDRRKEKRGRIPMQQRAAQLDVFSGAKTFFDWLNAGAIIVLLAPRPLRSAKYRADLPPLVRAQTCSSLAHQSLRQVLLSEAEFHPVMRSR